MGRKSFISFILVVMAGCSTPLDTADTTEPALDIADGLAAVDLPGVDIVLEVVTDELAQPDELSLPDDGGDVSDLPGQKCDPGEGCFLDPCNENAQCQSGWCVQHLGEGVCTQNCKEECPPGWSCQQVAGTDPDVIYICVSDYANLCRPCAGNADCTSTGGAEDACVDYGPDGNFCGGPCQGEQSCPWGFNCQEVTTADGSSLQQCVIETGVCPCTELSVALGLITPCVIENEYGLCAGIRTCLEEGLSDCDALVPAEETCDGLDNDCDGDIDEPALVGGDFVNLCDDDNGCTDDLCEGFQGCVNAMLETGSCDDGDPCTVADHCVDGSCLGDPVACDDENPCTDNVCTVTGGCEYPPVGGECDDANPCTLGDHCVAGGCVGQAVSCDCQADADCGALEDGNACNGTLVCETEDVPFQCVVDEQTVVVCPGPEGDDAMCLEAVCEPLSGECSLVAANDGLPCQGIDACLVNNVCEQGICGGGKPVNCNDGNPCTDDSCDSEAGCINVNNSAVCTDEDVCTTGDQCVDGDCAGGQALLCEDGNLCNGVESCNPQVGCVAGDPLVCDDGNPCDGTESCEPQSGCQEGADLVCDDGNACNGTESCAPDTGCVSGQPLSCDDGDICNGLEMCDPKSGCVSGMELVCDDGNACNGEEACLPQKGCVDGDPPVCDDEDFCNGTETCDPEDGCISGENPDCNDDNICTLETCDPALGCQYSNTVGNCDDGNKCTLGDSCVDGACQASGLTNCSDDDVCTTDICDPVVGCLHLLNDAPCDDDDLCTYGDKCQLGECKAAGTIPCNDGNACTDDSCIPQAGCQFVPNSNLCDDTNVCTTIDECSNGWCVGTVAKDCTDDNPCTDDFCDAVAGCLHINNNVICDDADACTENDVCSDGGCQPGVPIICADVNGCTDDSCAPESGCVFTPNDDSCDDEDACTVGDYCADSECQSGPDTPECDDSSVCTVDTCEAESGCVYTALDDDTPCLPDGTCTGGVCIPNIVDSCQTILFNDPDGDSGVYVLDPDGDGGVAPFSAFCEMNLDGGGWTLAMSINTADGHKAFLPDAIWTTHDESGSFASRWSNDYKSLAAVSVTGTQLLVIVRNASDPEGANPVGWRSWNLDGEKAFQDFFDVSLGSYTANASGGGCNSGHAGDGRKQTTGVASAGVAAPYDTFTGFAQNIYTNSYYGHCEPTSDGFRLSSWYRWSNNANVGLGLQMDSPNGPYCLEAGSHMKIDTYGNPQRYCTSSCGNCTAYLDGGNAYSKTKAAIGTDHNGNHCTVGVSYRYEWYVR